MKLLLIVCLISLNAKVLTLPGRRINWSTIRLYTKVPKVLGHYTYRFHSRTRIHSNHAVKRIFGGNEAIPHGLPYQVGILLSTPMGLSWCGGALISKKYVLTAAHCLDYSKSIILFIGAHEIRNSKEDGQLRIHVDRSNFIIHPHWNPRRFANDIGLVRLPGNLKLSDKIEPIDLPSSKDEDYEGNTAVASGWGRYTESTQAIANSLRYVELPILEQRECAKAYPEILRRSNICTSGAYEKSTCSGDSGGPLVVLDGHKSKTLVGITSFGSIFGCDKGYPAVYARVSYYLDWIKRNTASDHF